MVATNLPWYSALHDPSKSNLGEKLVDTCLNWGSHRYEVLRQEKLDVYVAKRAKPKNVWQIAFKVMLTASLILPLVALVCACVGKYQRRKKHYIFVDSAKEKDFNEKKLTLDSKDTKGAETKPQIGTLDQPLPLSELSSTMASKPLNSSFEQKAIEKKTEESRKNREFAGYMASLMSTPTEEKSPSPFVAKALGMEPLKGQTVYLKFPLKEEDLQKMWGQGGIKVLSFPAALRPSDWQTPERKGELNAWQALRKVLQSGRDCELKFPSWSCSPSVIEAYLKLEDKELLTLYRSSQKNLLGGGSFDGSLSASLLGCLFRKDNQTAEEIELQRKLAAKILPLLKEEGPLLEHLTDYRYGWPPLLEVDSQQFMDTVFRKIAAKKEEKQVKFLAEQLLAALEGKENTYKVSAKQFIPSIEKMILSQEGGQEKLAAFIAESVGYKGSKSLAYLASLLDEEHRGLVFEKLQQKAKITPSKLETHILPWVEAFLEKEPTNEAVAQSAVDIYYPQLQEKFKDAGYAARMKTKFPSFFQHVNQTLTVG